MLALEEVNRHMHASKVQTYQDFRTIDPTQIDGQSIYFSTHKTSCRGCKNAKLDTSKLAEIDKMCIY